MALNDQAGNDWTREEVDLIVADYFDMLNHELTGRPYVKLHRNKALQKLIGRSHGSIEFKHRNISAVLIKLGYPWIIGYRSAVNYQKSLIDGISRYLKAEEKPIKNLNTGNPVGFSEKAPLFFEQPPKPAQEIKPEPAILKRLVRKFDPAKRDARNKKLGYQGEETVYHAERIRLISLDRPDLAKRVSWVSQEKGDGAGYDILSFEVNGNERFLEVKTTTGHQTTPFYISENERSFSEERPDAFRLVRLYDFARTPRAFQIEPPLESSMILQAINFRASF